MTQLARRSLALLPVLLLLTILLGACEEEVAPSFESAFGAQAFEEPVDLAQIPGGSFLLADKRGVIAELTSEGASGATVLDLRDRVAQEHEEQGLLSFAVGPSPQDRFLWVYYIAPDPLRSVLSRFALSPDGVADPQSELIILEVPQPFENHNGGAVRFGPDQMLYLSLGDGGGAFDPLDAGQDPSNLFGAILRLDVRAATPEQPYRIPADNPFVGVEEHRPEIWAFGFRNPWRMSFDTLTGELWVGDVGQHEQEEVNVVRPGANYGWDHIEGTICLADACDFESTTPPELTYTHDDGCSITGGLVYRGSQIPALRGHYVFGDLCEGTIWALTPKGELRELGKVDGPVVSFAADLAGEIYVLKFGGPILRLGTAAPATH